MSGQPIRLTSLKLLEEQLHKETDPQRRENMRMLLDEMGEIYPDFSEIPDDPKKLFKPLQELRKNRIIKVNMSVIGRSSSGKTYFGGTASHCTPKYIDFLFKSISSEIRKEFKEYLSRFIPFTPLWVIGTEESTLDCFDSDDNKEYFKHSDINIVETLVKSKGGTNILNYPETYKNILIALYALANEKQGTILLDSGTTPMNAQHEIMRRIIMKIPSIKREQGINPRHWFWRNVEQEGLNFFLRIVGMNTITTYKIIDQHLENGVDIEKIKWYEEASRHLSSIIIYNEQIKGKKEFMSTIQKCRINSNLDGLKYQNFTMPKFMFKLYEESKKVQEEKE